MTTLLNDDSRDTTSNTLLVSNGFGAYNMDELGATDDGFFDEAPSGVVPRVRYYARRIDGKTCIIIALVILLIGVLSGAVYLAATRQLTLALVPATPLPPSDPLNNGSPSAA